MKNKKLKLTPLLMFLLIYLLYIPFRLLKLSYYFITSKEDFRTSLILLTLKSFDLIKDLQIEILYEKTYLNCNNLIKLGSLIINDTESVNEKIFYSGMKKLQNASRNFTEIEEKYGRREVNLMWIYDAEGKMISKIPHYTVIKDSTSLHATSNVCKLFASNQRVEGLIPTLTKTGAKKAGSIVTFDVAKVKIIQNRTAWVPVSELHPAMMNYDEFEIESSIKDYQIEKQELFRKILIEDFKLNKNINTDLIQGLRQNEFRRDLNSADSDFIKNTYTSILKDIRRDNEIL